jgi:glycosyltransferase involved in cell wall biosynthesis
MTQLIQESFHYEKDKKMFVLGNTSIVHAIHLRLDLLRVLKADGFSITVNLQKKDSDAESLLDSEQFSHTLIPYASTALSPLKDLWFFIKLYRYLKQFQPSHVLLYHAKAIAFGSIAARLLGIKNTYSIITGLGYSFTKKGIKPRIIKVLQVFLYQLGLSRNKRVLFQNADDRDYFSKLKIVKPEQALVTNGSGVDTTHYYFTNTFPKTVHFLMISRLLYEKGVVEYFKAAKLIEAKGYKAHFTLVGFFDSNPGAIQQDKFKEWLTDSNVQYIESVKDLRPFIERSSVYVLPSYREGMPRSVLEAMSMGRAIITTDVPGCRSTVLQGENGFLVPAQDAQSLANVMETFIENPDLIPLMGAKSRQLAEERFDVCKVNAFILKVIRESEEN